MRKAAVLAGASSLLEVVADTRGAVTAAAVTAAAVAAAAVTTTATAAVVPRTVGVAAAVAARAVAALEIAARVVAGRRAAVVAAYAASHALGAELTLTIVVGFVVLHARAFLEHVAVGDAREVAKDVLAARVGSDEA